ncbi:MAG: ribonuclease H-like domain-containing protein [Chthonomonadales bacterium]
MDLATAPRRSGFVDLQFGVGRLLPGLERVTEQGRCHEASWNLEDIAPWTRTLADALPQALGNPALLRLAGASDAPSPAGLVCLDIETLGLMGEPIFLVGLAEWNETRGIACRQFFARTLDEEAAVLAATCEDLTRVPLLVTFNGINFDVPYLQRRMRCYGIAGDFPPHVDVLLEARKRFAGKVPDCRLQTLEAVVCGRRRTGDVDGSEIPAAYRRFLMSGDGREVASIARHNVLDLATTLELLVRLWGSPDARPWR